MPTEIKKKLYRKSQNEPGNTEINKRNTDKTIRKEFIIANRIDSSVKSFAMINKYYAIIRNNREKMVIKELSFKLVVRVDVSCMDIQRYTFLLNWFWITVPIFVFSV